MIGHDILEKVRTSPEIGLMVDESTYFCNKRVDLVCSYSVWWGDVCLFSETDLYY